MFRSLRASENFHILLWLVKDLCWVMTWRTAGTVMILPTVSVAVWLAWRCRQDKGELFHAIAVVSWICANSIWMLGEFFRNDGTRPLATVFFVIGLLFIAWYYLFLRPRGAALNALDASEGNGKGTIA